MEGQLNVNNYTRNTRHFLLRWAIVVMLFGLFCLPFIAPQHVMWSVRDAAVFGLAALSLDILWGRCGLMSFGHAAFFGLGAYTSALVSIQAETNGFVGLAAASCLGFVAALLLGLMTVGARIRGAYFAMITLATTICAEQIAIAWVGVTGGDAGLVRIPSFEVNAFKMKFLARGSIEEYYLAAGALAVALLLARLWLKGPMGTVLTSIIEDESRVESLGYNTSRYLVVIFALSGSLAAASGAMYANMNGFVVPDLIGARLSTELLLWVAIGIRGSLFGPPLAALAAWRLQHYASSINPHLWPLALGFLFIIVAMSGPIGIWARGKGKTGA
jgi:branched-chain amino acid transport system permease protein